MSDMAGDARPSDRYIPWLVVLFFAVFMSVDAVMVTMAVRTHSGVVTEQAYEKGLAYNRTLAAAQKQAQGGWRHEMTVEGRQLRFSLRDEAGQPVRGAGVRAIVKREVAAGHDFEAALRPVDGEDYYAAVLDVPMPGTWQVRVFAQWQSRHYQAGKTFMIP